MERSTSVPWLQNPTPARLATVGLIVHVILGVLLIFPGHLSVDEGVYHMMVRAVDHGTSPEIWNGYQELETSELRILKTYPLVAVEGRLVSQYPPFFAQIAWPFYAVFGFWGLFLLNLLLYPVTVWATWRIGNWLDGPKTAMAAALCYVLGTFAWAYSPTAWPHMLALACSTTALMFFFLALEGRRWLGLVAGMLVGIAVGVRLDSFFSIAAMVAMVVLFRPNSWRVLGLMLLGLAPCIALISVANMDKFGTYNPLSYGPRPSKTRTTAEPELLLVALAGLAAWWSLRWPPLWRRLVQHWRWLAAGTVALMVMVLLSKYGTQPRRMLSGALTLLVDLRWMPDKAEPALRRSEYGALIYMGGYKKALLQSAPILVLALLTGRLSQLREKWLLLLILPAGLLVYLGRTVWHGGLCLNLRYLLPVLPVLSVAAAPVLLRLWDGLTAKREVLLGVALSLVLLILGLSLERKVAVLDELLILWAPLVLAAGLLLSQLRGWLGKPTAVLLGATLSWGLVQGAGYDFAHEADRRNYNLQQGLALSELIEDDSLVLASRPGPWFQVVERHRVRLALPFQDQLADLPALVQTNADAGRAVYVVMSTKQSRKILKRLKGWGLKKLGTIGPVQVQQLTPPTN